MTFYHFMTVLRDQCSNCHRRQRRNRQRGTVPTNTYSARDIVFNIPTNIDAKILFFYYEVNL